MAMADVIQAQYKILTTIVCCHCNSRHTSAGAVAGTVAGTAAVAAAGTRVLALLLLL